jgi:hypothetical protein
MGATSERGISAVHRQALELDTDVIERTAVRLNQRSILRRLPLKYQHEFRFHLVCDSERRFPGREIVRNLRGP